MREIKLTKFCAILSVVNLVCFNIPFLRYAWDNADNSWYLCACLAVLLLVLNFWACYLVCFLLRRFGRVLAALCHFISTGCVYYIFAYNVMMDESMIGNFFNRRAAVLAVGSSETVFDIYGRILFLAKSEKLGTQEAIGGFIYALLGYIYHKIANFSVNSIKNLEKVQRAQIMLREDVSGHISPAEIAARLGISYSLLRDRFKAITGVSMAEYALNQRMNRAKTLLSSSDKSIKEIAFEAGYESVSRFCCAFKQAVGITASEFRSRNRHSSRII